METISSLTTTLSTTLLLCHKPTLVNLCGKMSIFFSTKFCSFQEFYLINMMCVIAGHATFLEHLLLMMVVGIPIIGTFLIGYGSLSLIYCYVLTFDLLRCLGHSNVEIIPYQIFEAIPFLKYIILTPT